MWTMVYDQVRKVWAVRLLKDAINENRTNLEAGIDKGFVLFGVYDTVQEADQNLSRFPRKIPE